MIMFNMTFEDSSGEIDSFQDDSQTLLKQNYKIPLTQVRYVKREERCDKFNNHTWEL